MHAVTSGEDLSSLAAELGCVDIVSDKAEGDSSEGTVEGVSEAEIGSLHAFDACPSVSRSVLDTDFFRKEFCR